MPPRPRPRPRATPAISASPPSPASSPRARAKKIEEDEDALFIRNQGRSVREASKRAERAEAVAPPPLLLSDGEGEGEDSQTPGQKRKQSSYYKLKAAALPAWTKKGAILHLLEGSDEDAEGEVEVVEEDSGPAAWAGKRARSRSRSRSRSLTPAPALTQAEALRAHQAIQLALGGGAHAARASSDESEDDGDGDGAVLDPELQSIARAIRERVGGRGGGCGAGGGPADVRVRVKWVAHPGDDAMHGRPQASWSFTVDRHRSLKELFVQTAAKAYVPVEDLVIMRDGRQVFTGVSLDGLGVWDEADLEACERGTFEALRSEQFRSPTPAQHEGEGEGGMSEGSAGDEDEKIKLVLRAAGAREVTLSVRPRTTCGKIVRAFLAVVGREGREGGAGGPRVGKVQLCIDGARQDAGTAIVDCDVEDGDMVEVVGF